MNSRGVKRVEDVLFLDPPPAEDAGPLAHPARPDAFTISQTLYADCLRERRGSRACCTRCWAKRLFCRRKLYFERFDGQAVTCDDFVDCMAETGRDLEQFRRWYEQAGTPELSFDEQYDAQSQRYILTLRQAKPAANKGDERPPLVIPVATGLLVNGKPLDLGVAIPDFEPPSPSTRF